MPLLGIYPKESKAGTQISLAASITKVKRWEQPECASRDEWMKQMWYLHTVEYYSVLKME